MCWSVGLIVAHVGSHMQISHLSTNTWIGGEHGGEGKGDGWRVGGRGWVEGRGKGMGGG